MSVDNRTQIQDCEDFTGDTWTANAQGGDQILAGLFYEGTGSIETQHSDSDDETWTPNDSASAAISVTMADSTLYLIIKDNLLDTFANGGSQMIIGDGTNRIGYDVGGGDAQGIPLNNYFRSFKLDGEQAAATPGGFTAFAGSEGSLNFATISQVGYGSLHLSKAQGNVTNAFIDSITHLVNTAYALTINGGTVGTPETMSDVAGDDITNGWGMVSNPLGSQFVIFASTEWGDPPAGVADTYFTATDEQWYLLGDNGGGRPMGVGNFIFRVVGNTTGTNSWVLTRVTIVNTGTRAILDLSDSNVDFMQLDGCVFTDLGVITMPTVDVDKFCNDTVFNNCDRIDLQSLDCDGCTFNGTTDADGAIIWDENTTDSANQDNLTFNSDGTGNAIEVAPTGAGPFTYNIDGYTFDSFASQDGTDTDRVFFINPSTLDADITINLSNSQATNPIGGGSDNFSHRDVGSYTGTLIIQQTVTLTVTVQDTDGVSIPYAKVRIENASTGALLSDGFANNLGLFTDGTFSFASETDVTIVVRKNSPGDTRYSEVRQPGTIVSTGLSTTVSMAEDTNAGIKAPVGILKTGVIFEDVSDTSITMTITLPAGTSRKLVVGALYWDSSTDLTVSSATYDAGGMTNIAGGSTSEQEGAGNFHEIALYRQDIPDVDTGDKDIVITWSTSVNVKAIAFAIIDDVATGAEDDSGLQTGDQVTSNPTVSVNNSSGAWSVVFLMTDDTNSPTPTGVATLKRSDQVAEASPGFDGQMVAVLTANRTATGAHSLGADYGAGTKTWVAGGATFLKN